MRKLATIRTINKITPIPKKDRIALATIDGWNVIIKKDQLSEGDPCVFFEIDSFLPDTTTFAFLGKTKDYKGIKGHRIKTMKMASVVSQGLALPLDMFPELVNSQLGDDVTELLNVVKYDNTIVTSNKVQTGQAKSRFPSFLRKTDQERLQNLMVYFDIHKDTEFEETLKYDGSSMTVYKQYQPLKWWQKLANIFAPIYVPIHFGVCSRNLELKEDKPKPEVTFKKGNKTSTFKQSQFWEAAIKYNLEENLPLGYAIQGELLAPNIQSNHEKVSEVEFHIFDVWNIDEQRYLNPRERYDFCTANLPKIPHVKILNQEVKIFQECPTIDSLLSRIDTESFNPDTISEGRVYKAVDNPEITFKLINNKYLLKSEK